MKKLKGTKTASNLITAFAGESQAVQRYTLSQKIADKEGYKHIAKVFEVVYKDTKLALKGAIDGENDEAETMYPEFAKVAKEEGFDDIAKSFTEIGEVEEHHRDRYKTLLDTLEAGEMFKKDEVTIWKCLNCGYIFEGKEAPKVCPACKHPQGFFMAVGLVK